MANKSFAIVWTWLIFLLVIPMNPAAAQPLVLAKNGVAKAVVFLPANPSETERLAAEEISNYLGKMSGGSFPIIEKSNPQDIPKGAVISIGRTSLAKGLAMGGPEWKQKNSEAFRILRKKETLLICGNQKGDQCDSGTLFGVHAFLESLGIGWYLPNPLGEVVPARPTIEIGDVDITDAPVMEMRWTNNFDNLNGYPERNRNDRRNLWFSHMLYLVLSPEIKKSHPEYFNPDYCLSNPEVRKLFVDFTREQFQKKPSKDMSSTYYAGGAWSRGYNQSVHASSLWPDDDEGPTCICSECTRLRSLGKPERIRGGLISRSDLFVDFYNAVAKGFADDYPDRYVVGGAYISYIDPPEKTRVHPNVIMMFAPLQVSDELHHEFEGIVKGWRDMGLKKMYWYGYDMGNEPMPAQIAMRFRNYKRWKVEGLYIEHRPTVAFSGLNYWLESKLAWNWDLNVNDLVEEFCTQMYGPKAGIQMRNIFIAWEVGHHKSIPGMFQEAKRLAGDSDGLIAKRIKLFELGYALCRGSHNINDALKVNDYSGAYTAAKKVEDAYQTLQNEYPWAYREWDHYGSPGRSRLAAPMLEKVATSGFPKLDRSDALQGMTCCLTDNRDIPDSQRINTGVQAAYEHEPNNPGDPQRTNLFDGGLNGGWGSVVGFYGTDTYTWAITLDFNKPYQIDKVELSLGVGNPFVPLYVEVQVSQDGKNFQTIDYVFPRTLQGWVSSHDLQQRGRYVRLNLISTVNFHDIGEVRVWGQKIPE